MLNMNFSGGAAIFVLIFICNGVTGEDIYVSSKSSHGSDTRQCGISTQQPCTTLKYAIWKANNRDTIVIKCQQDDIECKMKLTDQIRIASKQITIKGADDNLVSPTLEFLEANIFHLSGSKAKLTISNLSVHLRRSFGTVLDRHAVEVNFEHCKILLKKETYYIGVGRDLIFIRVKKTASLKMKVTNCDFVHPELDEFQILNLIMADGVGFSVDVSVQQTTFNGNMAVYFKASGRGSLYIDQIYSNHTAVFVEGRTQKRTWAAVNITQAEFTEGFFQQQLRLYNLEYVELKNVIFSHNGGDGMRCQNINKLFMKNCNLKSRRNNILSTRQVSIIKTRLSATNLVIQTVDNVTISEMQSHDSIIDFNFIEQLSEAAGKHTNSEFEMFHVNQFKLADSTYSTSPVKVSESNGTVYKCEIEGGNLQAYNSRLVINESQFYNSTAINGGAVYSKSSLIHINRTLFTNCSAKYHGGSIYSAGEGRTVLNNVSFVTYVSESRQPGSFGTVIYSTSPIELTDVKINMEKSTSSPLIYIKPTTETENCQHSSGISGSFQVRCPLDRKVVTEQQMDDMNDFCIQRKSLRFLAVSCTKCLPGYSNPYKSTLELITSNHTFSKKNNTCFSCTKLEQSKTGSHLLPPPSCPKFVPLTTIECVNDHVIKTTQVDCPEGYSLNIFSNKCVRGEKSNNKSLYIFWGIIVVTSFLYAIILMYIKELVVILKVKDLYFRLKSAFENCCRCCFGKQSDLEGEEYLVYDDVMSEEFDFVMVQHEHVLMSPLRFTMGTTSGMIKIIFFFYQVEALIRVRNPFKTELESFPLSFVRDTISTVLSFTFNYNVDDLHVIPITGMTRADKEIFRGLINLLLLAPVCLLIFSFILRSLNLCQRKRQEELTQKDDPEEESNSNTYEDIAEHQSMIQTIETEIPKLKVPPLKNRFERVDGKVPIYVEMPLHFRIMCFLLIFITLAYLPISTLILRSIPCSQVDGILWNTNYNMQCYQVWQYLCMVLVAVWVVPFPAAVYFASRMQYTCKIAPGEFFLCLLFPPSLLIFYTRNRLSQYRRTISKPDAMLAKHLLMVMYEPFRLQKTDKRFDVMWDVVYLTRKLVFMVLTVFAPVSVSRYLVLIFLIICLVHHLKVKPFNRCLTNRLEIVSLILLWALTVCNIFWGHQDPCLQFPFMREIRVLVLYAEYVILFWPLIVLTVAVPVAIILLLCSKKKASSRGSKGNTDNKQQWYYAEDGKENMIDDVGDSTV